MEYIVVNVPMKLFEHETKEHIENLIIERATEKLLAQMDPKAKTLVIQFAGDAINERVETLIEENINEGWQKTTSWGDPVGKRVSLGQMIRDQLDEKIGQKGCSRNKTWLEERIEKVVNSVVDGELKGEIEGAKKKFREAVDTVLVQTVKANLARSLGLKL